MSTSDDAALDPCPCCEPPAPASVISNPPGQPRLAYRIDTQPGFLRRMLRRLPAVTVPPGDARPLARLTARTTDDPSVALLDAWAVVADVITFYQERIANEGFLRTATERRSVLELARAIGYELSPGVAAAVDLVFTMEDAVGAPRRAFIPIGTRVMSIPGQDEKPQTFETVEAFEARTEWNRILPRREDPERVLAGLTDLFVAGTSNQLQPGDALLFLGKSRISSPTDTNWDVRLLTTIEIDPPARRTHVTWDGGLGSDGSAGVFVFRKRAALYGHNAQQLQALPDDLRVKFDPNLGLADWDFNGTDSFPGQHLLDLDVVDPKILPGTWVALASGVVTSSIPAGTVSAFPLAGLLPPPFPLGLSEDPIGPGLPVAESAVNRDAGLYQVLGSPAPSIQTRAEFAMTATVTRVTIDNVDGLDGLDRRRAMFHAESEALALSTRPVIAPVDGKESVPGLTGAAPNHDDPTGKLVTLGQTVTGLEIGRKVALTGKRATVKIPDDVTLRGRLSARIPSNAPSDIASQLLSDMLNGVKAELLADDGSDRKEAIAGKALEILEAPVVVTPFQASRATVPFPFFGSFFFSFLFFFFEFIIQLLFSPRTVFSVQFPMWRWRLRSPTGLTGTVDFPPFAIEFGPAASDAVEVSEIGRIAEIVQAAGRAVLRLELALRFIYDRATLSLSANVAAATHGETVADEVLGSGDATVTNQSFVLKKKPLTFVSSPDDPSGEVGTLAVRVNDVLWREVRSLFGQDPRAQVYALQLSDDGETQVMFGDGIQGARLPTGTGNVRATYRSGLGPEGEVGPGSLALLITRPLGVRGVANPLAATGAAAPARLEDARQNAPLTVRTLDRVVSVGDVEDFARAFAGIGKAQARSLWNGKIQLVHLTIAGATGKPVPDSPLRTSLETALAAFGDPSLLFRIDTYLPRQFGVSLQVKTDERLDRQKVLADVRAELLATFGFPRRDFGQPVREAEILVAVQRVRGVVAANVLRLSDDRGSTGDTLVAAVARFDDTTGAILLAELLTINPKDIVITDLPS
jgi:hypothetical protein